jgi:hypothetical protein
MKVSNLTVKWLRGHLLQGADAIVAANGTTFCFLFQMSDSSFSKTFF